MLPQKPEEQEETLVTPTEEKVEVIKVCELVLMFVCIMYACMSQYTFNAYLNYLGAHLCYLSHPCHCGIQVFLEARPDKAESVRMLTDEVSQIQEVSV